MNFLRKAIKNQIFLHIILWLGIYLLGFVAVFQFDTVQSALTFTLVFATPLIIPVYLHSYVFKRFFQKKRIYIYTILTGFIVLLFGFVNKKIFEVLIGGETESYVTLIFFMVFFTGIKFLQIGTKQQFQLQQEEKRRVKAENELLKSQINPHFLFNTLNSIYSLIMDKEDLAGDAVLKLSGLMRYLLDKSKHKRVSLEEEIEFIENYISLEQIRLDERCKISFEVKGDSLGKNIAPMMLMPFIENAFKHGISASAKNNFINILLTIGLADVQLKVENSIAPEKSAIQEKENKMGIESVKQRLELLYPDKYSLDLAQREGVFEIELRIDL